jgi:hypothetical protein
MTTDPQDSDKRIRRTDVSRLPFTAGVVLGISGLNTLVQGLYTISYWQGWLFVVLEIIVAGTGVMLVLRVPGASIVALGAAIASLINLRRMGADLPLVQHCRHRARPSGNLCACQDDAASAGGQRSAPHIDQVNRRNSFQRNKAGASP